METHITRDDAPGVMIIAALLITGRERMTGNTLKKEDRRIAVLDAIEVVEEVQAEIETRQPVIEDEGEEEGSDSKPELVGDEDG